MKPSTNTTTYRGSCRCGAIRFEADLDLSQGTTRCNCSFCFKSGWWGFLTRPESFRLLAGEDHIVKLGTSPAAERPRCRACGIDPFGHGVVPELGGEYYSINVRCLDGIDLDGVLVRYLDGKHDTWAELAAIPYRDPFVGAGAPGLEPAWET
jgi:hypothetical protein